MIVGNCQAPGLEIMLRANEAFSARFELVSFPPVHEIDPLQVPELHRAVAAAAVVVSQRVDEGYRDGIGLGTETLAAIAARAAFLRWPSVYWAGYFPDLFYLRDGAGRPVLDGPFDYHDRAILEGYAAGTPVTEVCRLLADPARHSDAQARAADATAHLELVSRDCDVDVVSFISSRFRDELLFFTMNHPTNRLLAHIAQQIADLIGVGGSIDHSGVPDDMLGANFYPLHANHARALALRFADERAFARIPFTIRGVAYEPIDAVQAFFDYYAANRDLVEINLDATPA